VIAAVLTTLLAAFPGPDFVATGGEHGVAVFRRSDGHAIELAAEGEIDAPPERVRAVLLDYGRHPTWVKHLSTSVVLVRESSSLLVYQRLALPIIEDRDFTLLVSWGADGDELWTRFSTANERGPGPLKHVVRVQLHEGEWRLGPIDGGRRTRARYRFRMDLGGSLPGWLGRSRAGKDVPALFDAIREQARRL
jgi:hypothetical protein